jgi:hypothetical protein
MALNVNSTGALVKPNPTSLADMPVPVGQKAVSPTNNIKPPKLTLAANQVAPKDLSSTYGKTADGTVYNKSSHAKFSNPADFFKDSGQTSFDNIKFDEAYKPSGKETVYGQPAAPATATVPPIAPPKPAPTAVPAGPYTPPNQGTTGVNQGGIIGNLLGIAQNESPEVSKARADLKGLSETYAKQTSNLESSPIDLSLATGQQGILNRLFAAKQGAAQTALQSALTSQGQQISATQGAGSLNAPITNPQTGGLVTPSAAATTGQTTSGASNISSLVGQRVGADGKTQEFFNTQTGQGFANPQQLADFVNQQNPGANATAANVFQVLDQLKSSQGANGGALNPLNNVTSIAQQVLNGQISPSQAISMGGTVANWQGLLNQELQKQSGGKYDQSALQAAYDANQAVQGSQAQQTAAYQSAKQQAQGLVQQFGNLISTYGLNPNELNVANGVMQLIAKNTSDSRYKILENLANEIANRYAQVTGSGGTTTDMVRSISSSFIDQVASGQSILNALAAVDKQAEAIIANTKTPSTTNVGGNTGGGATNSTTLGLF